MVRDTRSPQDASTHQIWNSYLKEYRRYGPDTKRDGRTDGQRDGRTDGQTVRLLYASQSSFGGIKKRVQFGDFFLKISFVYRLASHPLVQMHLKKDRSNQRKRTKMINQ